MKKFTGLLVSVVVCEGVGLAASAVLLPSIFTWYAGLNKPFFTPPNWLFGPVWAILYLLMGISFSIIWEKVNLKKAKAAVLIFATQLALNFLWPVLFFGFHLPTLAFLEITFLWIAVYSAIKEFQPISETAAKLLWPYLLWVSYAALLNLAVALLN